MSTDLPFLFKESIALTESIVLDIVSFFLQAGETCYITCKVQKCTAFLDHKGTGVTASLSYQRQVESFRTWPHPPHPTHTCSLASSSRCQQCSWTVSRLKPAFVRSTAGGMLRLGMNMTLPSAERECTYQGLKCWLMWIKQKVSLASGMTFTCSLCSSDCPWGPPLVLPSGKWDPALFSHNTPGQQSQKVPGQACGEGIMQEGRSPCSGMRSCAWCSEVQHLLLWGV